MEHNQILFYLFLIFTGAALVSTVVLFTRQSLLVAYLLLGILLGPWGLKLVPNADMAREVGDVGIILLLFLLGLELNPHELLNMLRKISWIACVSSVIFFGAGLLTALLFGFSKMESLIIGATMMFSSTIIGLKLLPAAANLNKQQLHISEIMISVLLLQDLIAIFVMLFLHGMATPSPYWQDLGIALITVPGLLVIGFAGERYLLRPLLSRFEQVQEYVFLAAIAWCLGMAKLASLFGLSDEIGAFIAGVAIAEGPIAHYMANALKPIRDFCLVLFFFTIGARFNLQAVPEIIFPALVLAALMLLLKPWVYAFLLKKSGESPAVAAEAGLRLGQGSEFSLLLGGMAYTIMPSEIGLKANYLIQAATLMTFIISCYWVVLRYPTPMAMDKKWQRD
jgi:Kef-type K+ transport system membrane component KefB